MFKVLQKGCEPKRGSKYSACIDLYASEDVTIDAGETKLIGLGIKINFDEFWDDYVSTNLFNKSKNQLEKHKHIFLKSHYLQLMLRSSLGKKGLMLPNGVGIIDLDYQDEIKMIIHNPITTYKELISDDGKGGTIHKHHSNTTKQFTIKKGDKIAQITLLEHKSYLFGIDTDKEREGGFGSTGK